MASGDGHAGRGPASPSGRAAAPGPLPLVAGGGSAWEWFTPRTFTVKGHVSPPPSSAFDDLIGTKVSMSSGIFGDAEGVVVGYVFTYEGVEPSLELDVRFIDGRAGTVRL